MEFADGVIKKLLDMMVVEDDEKPKNKENKKQRKNKNLK